MVTTSEIRIYEILNSDQRKIYRLKHPINKNKVIKTKDCFQFPKLENVHNKINQEKIEKKIICEVRNRKN